MGLLTDGKDHYFTAAEALADSSIGSITDASPVAASAARDLPFPVTAPSLLLSSGLVALLR